MPTLGLLGGIKKGITFYPRSVGSGSLQGPSLPRGALETRSASASPKTCAERPARVLPRTARGVGAASGERALVPRSANWEGPRSPTLGRKKLGDGVSNRRSLKGALIRLEEALPVDTTAFPGGVSTFQRKPRSPPCGLQKEVEDHSFGGIQIRVSQKR